MLPMQILLSCASLDSRVLVVDWKNFFFLRCQLWQWITTLFFSLDVSAPIQEMSPSKEQEDSISHMCQQLTMGLSQLSSDDAFGTTQRVESTPPHNLTSPAFQAPSPRHTNETSKWD